MAFLLSKLFAELTANGFLDFSSVNSIEELHQSYENLYSLTQRFKLT